MPSPLNIHRSGGLSSKRNVCPVDEVYSSSAQRAEYALKSTARTEEDWAHMEIYRHRRGLARTIRAIENGSLTLGFIGGSITDSRGRTRWPEPVIAWFVKTFPGVRIAVENAAIGATGSDQAVFRAKRDLVDRKCDLVFVEYAVNDMGLPSETRFRTREGLLRKLLADGTTDVVLVYTFSQPMYDDMINNRVPDTIAEFEVLGKHYDLGSVWMGLHAMYEVMAGQMRWEEWLPDGLHPEHRGSLSYAQSVNTFLNQELVVNPPDPEALGEYMLPEPHNPNNWERTYNLTPDQVRLEGPWVIRRCTTIAWIDKTIETPAAGARLSFDFSGRGVSLTFDFGKTSADFRYRLDGGDWVDHRLDRPEWCPDEGWLRTVNIADDLELGSHTFELEVVHGDRPECRGTNLRLGLIGVVE